ncbi:SDR family oxidoreductase [Musicola paradisiaca]|uniref:NmrA family protein n=1 Tax=Musicola paradisiaca (strain Ech703) TaxID=579405 RepID=C6C565_MUSP7|nr:SDR family oxidoreductase [Musicola paradisiaca]ACS85675.1 NmrA family protein [Musicola paradisiaca Ech703]
MIAITGATGQLGRLVIDALVKTVSEDQIVAAVRDPGKASDLAAQGVVVRRADYDVPATLETAFAGVEKLLLISSSEVGKREEQHKAVIAAAKKAGVKLIVYTSLLHADRSPLGLAAEHLATEDALKVSGIPYVLLRNGWYTENYAASIAPALAHGAFIGAAGEGRIASASRQDYADAASIVLQLDGQAGKVYELAGDNSYTLAAFTSEIARQSGKPLQYVNLSPSEFSNALQQTGLPVAFADLIADSDAGAEKGALFDDQNVLRTLLGRPTTPYVQTISKTLAVL